MSQLFKQCYKVILSLFLLFNVTTKASAAQQESSPGEVKGSNNECIVNGSWPIASIEKNDLVVPEKIRSLNEYREVISSLEVEAGVYNYDLLPELIGLGLLSYEAGDHSDAVSVVDRALTIIRVNEGLYSANQLPLLELIIDSNIASNNWKAVADAYDLILWLNKRNYSENEQRLLPVLKRIRQWHIDAYNKKTGRSLEDHFSTAESLHKEALSILKKCTSDERLAMCFFHKACCAGTNIEHRTCPIDKS